MEIPKSFITHAPVMSGLHHVDDIPAAFKGRIRRSTAMIAPAIPPLAESQKLGCNGIMEMSSLIIATLYLGCEGSQPPG